MVVVGDRSLMGAGDSRADPGFSLGGGAKIMCAHAHYERGTELTSGRGPGPA